MNKKTKLISGKTNFKNKNIKCLPIQIILLMLKKVNKLYQIIQLKKIKFKNKTLKNSKKMIFKTYHKLLHKLVGKTL